jgi:hypothetical protein
MRKVTGAVLALLIGAGASGLTAQSANGSASVTIPEVLRISVGALEIPASAFDFEESTQAEATGEVSVETRANIEHAVDVTGSDLTMGEYELPLLVQATDSEYYALSGSAIKALGDLGRGTQNSMVSFKVLADLAVHAPGTYAGTITYTVVANY